MINKDTAAKALHQFCNLIFSFCINRGLKPRLRVKRKTTIDTDFLQQKSLQTKNGLCKVRRNALSFPDKRDEKEDAFVSISNLSFGPFANLFVIPERSDRG